MIKKNKPIKILFIIIILIIIIVSKFDIDTVNGKSMSPTINDGSTIISIKNTHIKCDDVIQFKHDDKYYIKRVVAVPYDIITYKDGEWYVNNIKTDYKFSDETMDNDYCFMIKNNEYFVMGDNHDDSIDSRDFGTISCDDITGKIIFWF